MIMNEWGTRVALSSTPQCECFLTDCVENENPFDSSEMGPKVSGIETRIRVDANAK